MARRIKQGPPKPRWPEGWVVSEVYKPEGNAELTKGAEFSIKGSSARYVFLRHVVNSSGDEWIDAWGPVTGRKSDKSKSRSFSPSRIKTVHRKKQSR